MKWPVSVYPNDCSAVMTAETGVNNLISSSVVCGQIFPELTVVSYCTLNYLKFDMSKRNRIESLKRGNIMNDRVVPSLKTSDLELIIF